jgi:hypothetical protein
LREAHRGLALSWRGRRLVPTAVAAALLVAVLLPAYLLDPFLQLGLGILAFAPIAFVTRAVTTDDLHGLLPRARLTRFIPTLRPWPRG